MEIFEGEQCRSSRRNRPDAHALGGGTSAPPSPPTEEAILIGAIDTTP